MNEDGEIVTKKTWARTIEHLNKIGYMDGASDGQNIAFQSSFDKGYKQGISFGFEIGHKEAMLSLQQQCSKLGDTNLRDPQLINCQMCVADTVVQENIGNLYNIQQESNIQLLESFTQKL